MHVYGVVMSKTGLRGLSDVCNCEVTLTVLTLIPVPFLIEALIYSESVCNWTCRIRRGRRDTESNIYCKLLAGPNNVVGCCGDAGRFCVYGRAAMGRLRI